MCISEVIQYKCGHLSVTVTRPCPLATASPAFPLCGPAALPVCGAPKAETANNNASNAAGVANASLAITSEANEAVRRHYAVTMCPACERILHSRWVLIREDEHRWLHVRGACACSAKFPEADILTRPGRVVGNVPIVSLYAAEWVPEHRDRHRSGKCACPGSAEPFGRRFGDETAGKQFSKLPFNDKDFLAAEDLSMTRAEKQILLENRTEYIQATFGRTFGTPGTPVNVGPGGGLLMGGKYSNARDREYKRHKEYEHKQLQLAMLKQRSPSRPMPVIGFPIGAGPEGVCHAAAWETCALRRVARRHSFSV